MSRMPLLTLALVALATAPAALRAQDPLPLYPANYKVIVENQRVRVLDFMLRKGAKEASHAHPAHVVYVLAPFRIRFTFPDGRTTVREAKAGEVLYSEAVIHASENIGPGDAHGILVELKQPPSSEATGAGEGVEEALTALTFIRGKEGIEEQLKEELLALEAPTRAEPGAIAYDLYQSTARPNEFVRFEMWRSPADLEAHKASPYLRASFERRKQEGWTTDITLWKRIRR